MSPELLRFIKGMNYSILKLNLEISNIFSIGIILIRIIFLLKEKYIKGFNLDYYSSNSLIKIKIK